MSTLKISTDAVMRVAQKAKDGKKESYYVTLQNVPVLYACVHKPKAGYVANPTDEPEYAWSVSVVLDEATKEKLLDMGINKGFPQIGVTKITKGKNRNKLKYPLENAEGEPSVWAPYDKLFCQDFARKTVTKTGSDNNPPDVLDSTGEPFTKDIGNGSICNVQLYVTHGKDGFNAVLNRLVVLEHVPYEGASGSEYFDEDLGVTIKVKPKIQNAAANEQAADDDDSDAPDQPATAPKTKKSEPPTPADPAFDDDIPF